jgi:hypothetical protein
MAEKFEVVGMYESEWKTIERALSQCAMLEGCDIPLDELEDVLTRLKLAREK